MKHNLLAMSDGTETPSGEDEEEDAQRSKPRKKRRVAAYGLPPTPVHSREELLEGSRDDIARPQI